MNTFGTIFRLTSAGESHGPALTGIIDGMPAGIKINIDNINEALARRRPSSTPLGSARHETDRIEILTGLFDGTTTGAPIAFTIANSDARSKDYEQLSKVFRPSHADFTYQQKYGIRDWRGGGRASARETALRVAAGAFADEVLKLHGIEVYAYASQIGKAKLKIPASELPLDQIYNYPTRCPNRKTSDRMELIVKRAREAGDTVGGIVSGIILGLPVGLGEPIFGKFHAQLAAAMMSINAAKGFDYGMGFDGIECFGSEMNDSFCSDENGKITTLTNHSGGIQGGITNGCPVNFRVAFKPVPTLMREYHAITDNGEPTTIKPDGRHDSCVIPRAVPIVKAMAQIVTLDMLLLSKKI